MKSFLSVAILCICDYPPSSYGEGTYVGSSRPTPSLRWPRAAYSRTGNINPSNGRPPHPPTGSSGHLYNPRSAGLVHTAVMPAPQHTYRPGQPDRRERERGREGEPPGQPSAAAGGPETWFRHRQPPGRSPLCPFPDAAKLTIW